MTRRRNQDHCDLEGVGNRTKRPGYGSLQTWGIGAIKIQEVQAWVLMNLRVVKIWRPEPGLLEGMYTEKKVSDFPVFSRDVTKQTLPGRE